MLLITEAIQKKGVDYMAKKLNQFLNFYALYYFIDKKLYAMASENLLDDARAVIGAKYTVVV